jgi:aminoglycoside N3'-acetyltransferase
MITKKEFVESLHQVIKKKDEIIVLYSDISKFLDKVEYNKKLISEILDLIESFITKNRTLILPSFSANIFLKTGKFDLKNSIDNIGVLPKEALKRNYFRTPQPLHSYLVFGEKKKEIKKLSYKTSWGEGSILDFMSKNNARICTVGLPWNRGCAYLHKFEEDYQVPWRYFKRYKGKMYLNKKFISKCEEIKYSLPKIDGELYNYYPFIKHIKKSKSFCKNDNKFFTIESVKTTCLDKIGRKIFLKDPWCIIKKRHSLINWIKNQKINDVILKK